MHRALSGALSKVTISLFEVSLESLSGNVGLDGILHPPFPQGKSKEFQQAHGALPAWMPVLKV